MKKVLGVFIAVTVLLSGSAFAGETGSGSWAPNPPITEQPATPATPEKPAGTDIDMPAKPTDMPFEKPPHFTPPLLMASFGVSVDFASPPGRILPATDTVPAPSASGTLIPTPEPPTQPSSVGINLPARPMNQPLATSTDVNKVMPPLFIASDSIPVDLASSPGWILPATGTVPTPSASGTLPAQNTSGSLIPTPEPPTKPSSVIIDLSARPTDMPLKKPTDFKQIKSPKLID